MSDGISIAPGRRERWSDIAVVMVTLLGPLLVGWGRGTDFAWMTIVSGLLMVVAPARRPPSKGLVLVLAILSLLPLCAFLPAGWFSPIPGRSIMAELGIKLPTSLSLQPRIALEAWMSFELALVWISYLVCREWTVPRSLLLSLYAAGISLITAIFWVAYLLHKRPAPWPEGAQFGFYPNRNHASNLICLGGIITVALGWRFARRRWAVSAFWFGAALMILLALGAIGSRAGMGLFLAGLLAWFVCTAWMEHSKSRLAVGLGVGLTAMALLLVGGSYAIERLRTQVGLGLSGIVDGRAQVHRDTVALAARLPWCGSGLGSFEPIFAVNRPAITMEKRVLHPESDWLWLYVELGWPGLLTVLAGLGLVMRGFWPFQPGSERMLRAAAATGVGVFLIHGLVDVAGHRFANVWPAAFLTAMALATPPVGTIRMWMHGITRMAGVICVATGVLWLGGSYQAAPFPVERAVTRIKAGIHSAFAEKQFDHMVSAASEGLRLSPLDFLLYYQRGMGTAFGSTNFEAASWDFHRARFLEPAMSTLPWAEGMVWLAIHQRGYAWRAFDEFVRRREPGTEAGYMELLVLAQKHPELMQGAYETANHKPSRMLSFFTMCSREIFREEIEAQIGADPDLDEYHGAQRTQLFELWLAKGDTDLLFRLMGQHTNWLADGWSVLSRLMAGRGDPAGACDLVRRFAERPVFPRVTGDIPVATLEKNLLARPNDYGAGYALVRRALDAGNFDSALRTLSGLVARADCPKYFLFLEFEARAARQDWSGAWAAWDRYRYM